MAADNPTPITTTDDEPSLYTFSLPGELNKLSQHAVDVLEMIRDGQAPRATGPDGTQVQVLKDLPARPAGVELRNVESAARNLIGAIGDYLRPARGG